MPNTWILVTDGAGARVYETRGTREQMRLIRDLPAPDPRAFVIALATPEEGERDDDDTRPVRPTRPAPAPESGRHARELAWLLGRARSERFFQRLVLVGPTDVLGSIRRELDPPTRALVTKELARTRPAAADLDDVVGL